MQTTSAAWKALWASGNARLQTRAVIAGNEYTQMSNPVIVRALTQQGLGVGNAVSATCQFSILTGDALPRAAAVLIEQRLTDGETFSEWLPAGTFYISRRTRDAVTGILTLECYDALLKANGEMPAGGVTWPRPMANVAADIALLLGVSLDGRTSIRTGAAYVIEAPEPCTTIHDVLARIAVANGGNWIITPAGDLRLVPVISASGAEAATQDAVDVEGVTGAVTVHAAGAVTGVRYSVDGEWVVLGDETGIVLEADVGAVIANDLYDSLRGTAYQAYDLSGAVYDPAAELGDYVRGGANAEVRSVLYSETATLGLAFRGDISAPEADELSDEYPYIGGNRKVLTAAKLYAAQQVAALDDALTQQDIFDRLTGSGAAQGIYLVDGQLYINMTYAHGGTLKLGGLNDVNGTLEVLDASGNIVGTMTKDGVAINSGSIRSNSADNTRRSVINVGDISLEGYLASGSSSEVMWRRVFRINTTLGTTPDNSTTNLVSGGGLVIQPGETNSVVIRQGATVSPNVNKITVDPFGITIDGPVSITGAATLLDSLTLGVPLDISNGGTGATTPAAARAALGILPSDYAIYNSVTDLGLTSGSATVLAAFNAMGTNAILICPAGEFASGEVPNTYGTVEIAIPSASARSYIHFYGKDSSRMDWRMYLEATAYNGNNGNLPSGNWVQLITIDNVYNGLDKTASGSALDARQGKALKDTMTMIGNGAFTLGTIAAGTSKVLKASASTHAMLVLSGPNVNLFGLYLIRISTSGTPNTVTVTQGSAVTFTPSDGKITLGNTASSGSISVNVIPLSGDSSNFSLT